MVAKIKRIHCFFTKEYIFTEKRNRIGFVDIGLENVGVAVARGIKSGFKNTDAYNTCAKLNIFAGVRPRGNGIPSLDP